MFDLHSHSKCSDGSDTPSVVVEAAKAKGLDLFALTDHDSVAGVNEAFKRAGELGLPMLSGAEMEAAYPATLHLLCLGMDICEAGFAALVERQREFRLERNAELTKKLRLLGMDVSELIGSDSDCITRAHYARALVERGFAASMNDAYDRILGKNGVAYVKQERLRPEQVINATRSAGGVVVLAHPMQMRCEAAPMVRELTEYGIWGIEAHYYCATPGETKQFTSLARANNLFVTCGSDYHGKDRPAAVIGGCYEDNEELRRTRDELNRIFKV